MSRHRPTTPQPRRIAIIGAGIAGLACARTLLQAGHDVAVLEASAQPGGRMATCESPFGDFDCGAQYFTVRDARLAHALEVTAPQLARRWSASAVRVLDGFGRQIEAAPPPTEGHWVAAPAMDALPRHWAQPLLDAGRMFLDTRVQRLQRVGMAWQLHTDDASTPLQVDRVICALPAPVARELLLNSGHATSVTATLARIDMAPCWTLMLAFPQAAQPGLYSLGPQWNAARSTHHRVAWLARESSKPQRGGIERWTVQASADWSREHAHDGAERAGAKLQKAFAEITGIRATPGHIQARLWPHARTLQPLGQPFIWDAGLDLGLCGDWCLGTRVEDAFVSGLELALAIC